ncbi:transposable element Tc1 transposase [Trichonephila clavipes]|uniref:Transposable element Tc1 transposase n=1 Tax=Trichonephila clavipes TaxID=2585209 RepID=A0A8X6S030_TRICX|nr:transposable element Tc1 transposase [Trichonephila clavipes]
MGTRRETSIDVRKFILRLFKRGKSYREIAKIVGRSHSCVQKIIGRFKSDGLIKNKSGRGRKSILSDVTKRKVLKDIKIDPKLSAVKLAAETSRIMGRSVSAETVRNVIRHAGYSSRVARKKPFISLQNQKDRLEFAKSHQMKTDNFWKKVIFSDESKFNIFGSDGRHTVWRNPNTALDPKNLHPTVKHGGVSVMVWGRMASNGVHALLQTGGRSEPAPMNRLVISVFGDIAVGLVLQMRVYPLDSNLDDVVLYSGCAPGKLRAWFLPDSRPTASLVGLRGGWRHTRTKLFSRLWIQCSCARVKALFYPLSTTSRFLLTLLPNNEMSK